MNTKLFKILSFILIFLGIVGAWFIIRRADVKNQVAENSDVQDPYGLDGVNGNNTTNGGGTLNEDGTITNEDGGTEIVDVTIIKDGSSLSHIFDGSVSGATFITEQRDIVVPETVSTEIVEGYDFSGYPSLKFGDDRKEVADLKTVLNRQEPSPSLSIDNAFDTNLKNAVIEFQTKNGLTPDGVVGIGTYKKLNDMQGIDSSKITSKNAPQKETVDIIRYMTRSGGLIYDQAVRKTEASKKITINPIPRVQESFFNDTGNQVIVRYFNNKIIETSVLKIVFPDSKAENATVYGELKGEFLPQNISFVTVSPDKKKLFYLSPTTNGVSGTVYNFATGVKNIVFSSTFSEWLPQWASLKLINLTTKASSVTDGFTYSLNPETKKFEKVLGGKMGLTSNISPDGMKVLYSVSEEGKISTYVKDLKSGSDTQISPSTLAEKCVWTNDSLFVYCAGEMVEKYGTFPDAWYQGKVSFEDAIWKYDVTDKDSEIVYNLKEKNGLSVDIINPMLNAKNDYLIFINKNDQSLWGLDLK